MPWRKPLADAATGDADETDGMNKNGPAGRD
jgi:hypothetical protein